MNCITSQRDQLIQMLSLNDPENPTFKCLIYDKRGSSIISLLFHEQNLRDLKITINYDIRAPRERVAHVPAVYFMEPTIANVNRLAKDAESGLYSAFHVNFTSTIPRNVLEHFAKLTAEKEFSRRIEKVYDQFIDFYSLENNFFNFDMKKFFANSHNTLDDHQAVALLDGVVTDLFSLLVTLNAKPVICFKKRSGPLRMVADKLKERVRKGRQSLFTGFGPERPLLLMVERVSDLGIALHHGSTYQVLVHDLIGIKNNFIKTEKNGKGLEHYLDSQDSFWMSNKGLPFPEVEQNYTSFVQDYKEKKEAMIANKETEKLRAAVNSLSETTQHKDLIDKHADIILESVLTDLQQRDIAAYYSVESALLGGQRVDIEELVETIKKGAEPDKIRLFLIHYLTEGEGDDSDRLMDVLTDDGVDLQALRFIKTLGLHRTQNKKITNADNHEHWAKFTNAFGQTLKSMKSLVAGEFSNCETAKVLGRLTETNEDEEYVYVDSQGSNTLPHNFSNVIVFVWGGASYVEYQNLLDWKARNSNIHSLIYGGTHLPTPVELLKELHELGATQTGTN